MSDDIQVGDKVRVTFETEVVAIEGDGTIRLRDGDSDDNFYYHPEDENFVHAVVTKKAVTTFKPGDVVRRKGIGYTYTIGMGGYVSHHFNHKWFKDPEQGPEPFTSEYYEKVELHEAPL